MSVQILQFIGIVAGSLLLGNEFGWQIGLGVGCISYSLMPYQSE